MWFSFSIFQSSILFHHLFWGVFFQGRLWTFPRPTPPTMLPAFLTRITCKETLPVTTWLHFTSHRNPHVELAPLKHRMELPQSFNLNQNCMSHMDRNAFDLHSFGNNVALWLYSTDPHWMKQMSKALLPQSLTASSNFPLSLLTLWGLLKVSNQLEHFCYF